MKEIFRYKVDAYLLAAHSIDKRGGTGKTFNWEIAKKVKGLGVPVIFSGGLNPENIVQAIIKVKPYAVDANSGLEKKIGKKDYQNSLIALILFLFKSFSIITSRGFISNNSLTSLDLNNFVRVVKPKFILLRLLFLIF